MMIMIFQRFFPVQGDSYIFGRLEYMLWIGIYKSVIENFVDDLWSSEVQVDLDQIFIYWNILNG